MDTFLNYLFALTPGTPEVVFWRVTWPLAIIILLIAILGLWWQRKSEKFINRLGQRLSLWGFTIGLIALLLMSFRYQNIYWFSMRALLYGWAVVAVIWGGMIAWWWFKQVPSLRTQRQKNQDYNKYLPGRK